MELKLARCTLRPWRVGDETSLVRNANNRRVWHNLSRLPHPYTRQDADAWIARASSDATCSCALPKSATGSASRTGAAASRPRHCARSPSTRSRHSTSAGCRRASSSGTRPRCACSRRPATRSRPAIAGTSRRTARRSIAWSTRWYETMPELPDVTAYVEALGERVVGARLERLRLATPFVLRSVDPPLSDVVGRVVSGVRRLGKRIVLALEGERFVVMHLMIAGRLHWKGAGARPPA